MTNEDNTQTDNIPSFLVEARSLNESLKATLTEIKTERAKLEEIKAFNILGGKTEGKPQEQPVDTKKKEAMEFWKGTGIDEAINKYG